VWTDLAKYRVEGFPNHFFSDSWAVGFWRTDHAHGHDGIGHGALNGPLGLKSMHPGSEFLKRLNRGGKRDARYFAVAADYEPTDLTIRSLVSISADKLIDRIFEDAENDLVCHCGATLFELESEAEALQSICAALAEGDEIRLAWIGYCEDDAERTIRPVAKAGADFRAFSSGIRPAWDYPPRYQSWQVCIEMRNLVGVPKLKKAT
jgi:hypothetical protein